MGVTAWGTGFSLKTRSTCNAERNGANVARLAAETAEEKSCCAQSLCTGFFLECSPSLRKRERENPSSTIRKGECSLLPRTRALWPPHVLILGPPVAVLPQQPHRPSCLFAVAKLQSLQNVPSGSKKKRRAFLDSFRTASQLELIPRPGLKTSLSGLANA